MKFIKQIGIKFSLAAMLYFPLLASAIQMEPFTSGITEVDDVLITAGNYSFGSEQYENGVPTGPARLEWYDHVDGSAWKLSGTLHMEGAAECARIRVVPYDSNGVKLSGAKEPSAIECPPGDDHYQFAIELESNVIDRNAAELHIEINFQNPVTNAIEVLGEDVVQYGPVLETSSTMLTSADYFLGNGIFQNGAPSEPAETTWQLQSGTVKAAPSMQGKLFINNAKDKCVRMFYEYFDEFKNLLYSTPGIPHCPGDNNTHHYLLQAGANYSGDGVRSLKMTIQRGTDDGTGNPVPNVWFDEVDGTTYLPHVPVFPGPSSANLP